MYLTYSNTNNTTCWHNYSQFDNFQNKQKVLPLEFLEIVRFYHLYEDQLLAEIKIIANCSKFVYFHTVSFISLCLYYFINFSLIIPFFSIEKWGGAGPPAK